MALNQEERNLMLKFQIEEAKWLDSIVRPMIPAPWRLLVEKFHGTKFGRLLHVVTDVVYISKILDVRILRSQDTTVIGGKGFRQNVDHGYRIDRVHVKVLRCGKEIASNTFPLGIIIKNNA